MPYFPTSASYRQRNLSEYAYMAAPAMQRQGSAFGSLLDEYPDVVRCLHMADLSGPGAPNLFSTAREVPPGMSCTVRGKDAAASVVALTVQPGGVAVLCTGQTFDGKAYKSLSNLHQLDFQQANGQFSAAPLSLARQVFNRTDKVADVQIFMHQGDGPGSDSEHQALALCADFLVGRWLVPLSKIHILDRRLPRGAVPGHLALVLTGEQHVELFGSTAPFRFAPQEPLQTVLADRLLFSAPRAQRSERMQTSMVRIAPHRPGATQAPASVQSRGPYDRPDPMRIANLLNRA
jgi:hypothetical protein